MEIIITLTETDKNHHLRGIIINTKIKVKVKKDRGKIGEIIKIKTIIIIGSIKIIIIKINSNNNKEGVILIIMIKEYSRRAIVGDKIQIMVRMEIILILPILITTEEDQT